MGSCNNMKAVQSDEYIKIGNGGGFTGIETIYTVYKNGQIEQNGKIMNKLKSSDVNQIFNNIETLKLNSIEWNKPGNLYKFIEYSINGQVHKKTWDSNSTEINEKLNLFYDHVNYLVQKSIK